jgi:hypothetical protein
LDRDRGVERYKEEGAVQAATWPSRPEAYQALLEIVENVYDSPFLLPSQAAYNESLRCQNRLAARRTSGGEQ